MLYLLFFLSGLSGLIYQVVWVRVFGNVFGNTIYSASIVVAVFMLGLGAGSYLIGAWADRRYAANPEFPLRAYGFVELVIALLGLEIALVLPHLDQVSAAVSSYVQEPSGWYALSASSYVARTVIAVALLAPITLLMGGTLTLLIRHLVRSDLVAGGSRIAALYGVNTLGAALGCFLTDFTLVPAVGLRSTQFIAIALNVAAGLGALYLSSRPVGRALLGSPRRRHARGGPDKVRPTGPGTDTPAPDSVRPLILTSLALALAGFAALGMEILWFRHMSILLGGFRAVFSLLLTVILVGIGIGSLAGGLLHRRTARAAEWFMAAQALFVAFALFGLGLADVRPIDAAPADTNELWFNARPILFEVGLPALLMGFSFPLANAMIQRAEAAVGRRAGLLYLANTAGAVCGSIAVGFLLLPRLGIQGSATVLAVAAALAIVPVYFASRLKPAPTTEGQPAFSAPTTDAATPPYVGASFSWLAGAAVIAGVALALWLRLPGDYVNLRALPALSADEHRLLVSDGLAELIAVTERPRQGRTLYTNGHAMSSTLPLSQRYMRALAHIPLLSMTQPEAVLVIGFGVGNTTHAATLHPPVRRVELADLSRDILTHAGYFADANGDVLADPKVTVHLNDGRQHLQMQAAGAYDLVALEPPPIAYAGVSALYSREFYTLARSRLKAGGYISQWLPAYQVPAATTLSMIRAFVDVFPQAVLLSGAEADLVLLGTTADRIEIDPARLASALAAAPAVRADLERIGLARPHEIVGAFLGSARTLAGAARSAEPVLDDRPLQEYGVRSILTVEHGVPGEVVNLGAVGDWCPRCFAEAAPVPAMADLGTYLRLVTLAYDASRAEVAETQRLSEQEGRTIFGSEYLGAIVPESALAHNVLGLARAERGDLVSAIAEFRRALALQPDGADTHWHLGAALASQGAYADALMHLQRAVRLDPANANARNDLAAVERFLRR